MGIKSARRARSNQSKLEAETDGYRPKPEETEIMRDLSNLQKTPSIPTKYQPELKLRDRLGSVDASPAKMKCIQKENWIKNMLIYKLKRMNHLILNNHLIF